jgi:hypothetical protein
MLQLQLIAVCALVVYRVTRFFLKDTLIDEPREWVYEKILSKQAVWRDKLYELLDCPYCLSIWFSAATIAVADRYTSVPLPVFAWLATAGLCMVVWRIVERDDAEG